MNNRDNINELNELYTRFCRGDKKAQNALYEKTLLRLSNYIRSKTDVPRDVVYDLVQDTWAKLWSNCPADNRTVVFSSRMHKIASSVTIDYWRTVNAKKRTTFEEELAKEERGDREAEVRRSGFKSDISMSSQRNVEDLDQDLEFAAEDIADDSGLIIDLKEAVQSLPLEQQQTLILHCDGKTDKEISIIMECKLEATRTRIRYAKQKLKKFLK